MSCVPRVQVMSRRNPVYIGHTGSDLSENLGASFKGYVRNVSLLPTHRQDILVICFDSLKGVRILNLALLQCFQVEEAVVETVCNRGVTVGLLTDFQGVDLALDLSVKTD